MVPARGRRRTKVERATMRLVATGGIIGIAVLLGAVLVGQDVDGWNVGLVVLAARLWSLAGEAALGAAWAPPPVLQAKATARERRLDNT